MKSEFPSPRADMRSLHGRSSKRLGCEVQACSKHVILSVTLLRMRGGLITRRYTYISSMCYNTTYVFELGNSQKHPLYLFPDGMAVLCHYQEQTSLHIHYTKAEISLTSIYMYNNQYRANYKFPTICHILGHLTYTVYSP